MTVTYITAALFDIRRVSNDPEAAHSMEDRLYLDVLRAISNLDDPARMRALAQEALKSQNIEFARWCA